MIENFLAYIFKGMMNETKEKVKFGAYKEYNEAVKKGVMSLFWTF